MRTTVNQPYERGWQLLATQGYPICIKLRAVLVALVVIGAASVRRIGYGRSAGSCAISCAGCSALILIRVVVLGILVAVLLEAAGSAGTP